MYNDNIKRKMNRQAQTIHLNIWLLGPSNTGKTSFLQSQKSKPELPQNQKKSQLVASMSSSRLNISGQIKKKEQAQNNETSTQSVQSSSSSKSNNSPIFGYDTLFRKILNQNYEISLSQTSNRGLQQNNTIVQKKLKSTQIFIIFFDVSSQQSFLDLGRQTYPQIMKINPNAVLIVIANKIDKVPVVNLKLVNQFCDRNGLKLFFNSLEFNPKKVLDDVILYYDSVVALREIRKSIDLPKKQGFFSKIFKMDTKLSESDMKFMSNLKKIQESTQTRLREIRNQLHKNEQKLKKQFIDIFLKLTNIDTSDISQKDPMPQYLQKWRQKLSQMHKNSQNIQQLYYDQKQKNLSLNKQKQKITKQNIKYREKYKKFMDACRYAIVGIREEVGELGTVCGSLRGQVEEWRVGVGRGFEDKIRASKWVIQDFMQKIQQVRSSSIVQVSTIGEDLAEKYSKELSKKNKIIEKLQSQKTIRKKFSQSLFLQTTPIQTPKTLLQTLQANLQTQITSSKKLYQSSLCKNTNFHTHLDTQSNLLYILQLKHTTLLIFTPQQFKDYRKGTIAYFYRYGADVDGLVQLETSSGVQMWRYDPIFLVFGKEEIFVRFVNGGQVLELVDRKRNRVFRKFGKLAEILGLPDAVGNYYPIQRLEVLQLQFNDTRS